MSARPPMRVWLRTTSLLGAMLLAGSPTIASETVSYTYDARGRLVQVTRSGTVNNGVSSSYSYDRADNRTNVTVNTQGGGGGTPDFSINDVSVTEGGNLVFTVTKAGATGSSYSVSYATANGTATAGSDYTAGSGTLTFAAADTTKTITIASTDDATVEPNETLLVNLSSATGGATISDAQGVGTIIDNDTAPTCAGVSFTIASNGAVTEGANSVFTITRSGTASGSCSVSYATSGGTATSGSDYTAASGTLTFTSAQTSQTVSVATSDDTAVESAETFTMSLSNPTGGSTVGTPASATATVNDNDSAPPVSFSVNDVAVIEGGNLVFTVTKSGTTSTSLSVDYATANGTATAGTDYTSKSGTLTFSPSQTSLTVSVATTFDTAAEVPETVLLNLSGATGGATISDAQGIGTIVDEEVEPPPEQCFTEDGQPIVCPFAAPAPEPAPESPE